MYFWMQEQRACHQNITAPAWLPPKITPLFFLNKIALITNCWLRYRRRLAMISHNWTIKKLLRRWEENFYDNITPTELSVISYRKLLLFFPLFGTDYRVKSDTISKLHDDKTRKDEEDVEGSELLTYLDEVLTRRAGSSRHTAGLPSQTRRLAALYQRLFLPERPGLLQDLSLRPSGILKLRAPWEDRAAAHYRRVRRSRQTAHTSCIHAFNWAIKLFRAV